MMIILLCFFHRDLVIANTNNPSFSEGNELYTEVQDTEDQNKEKQKPYIDQRTENPLYGDADAVFNPIYMTGMFPHMQKFGTKINFNCSS